MLFDDISNSGFKSPDAMSRESLTKYDHRTFSPPTSPARVFSQNDHISKNLDTIHEDMKNHRINKRMSKLPNYSSASTAEHDIPVFVTASDLLSKTDVDLEL